MSDSLCRTKWRKKQIWYLLPDAKYSAQIKLIHNNPTLIDGKPVLTYGGGGSDSDFRWDGRRPGKKNLKIECQLLENVGGFCKAMRCEKSNRISVPKAK